MDYLENVLGACAMSEEDAEKLSQVSGYKYLKEIWNTYKKKGYATDDFFGLVFKSVEAGKIELSTYGEDSSYHKLDEGIYVKIGKDVQKMNLYELEKKVNELK